MKKIYTGNINRLTVKNINIFPAAIDKLAFNSVVVEKNALFAFMQMLNLSFKMKLIKMN